MREREQVPPPARRPAPAFGLVALVVGVAPPPDALSPRGPAAAEIAVLWWVMFGLGMAVFVVVVALLVVASVRRRDGDVAADVWTGEGYAGGSNLLIVAGGVVLPAAVVVGLMIMTVNTAVRAATVGDTQGEPLVVEITGHKFWWDVRYPEHGIRIANEVHLPVGQPVDITVTSADVIHSFWLPELGGKVDVNPGHVNTLRLVADEPGTYRGVCGEFCGVQHARMHFIAVAHGAEEFDEWVAERQDAAEPDDDVVAGEEVFVGAGCAECHTVEGLSPTNDAYPDLTHFADRLTIGAGAVANTRGNLGGWIMDPQGIKPGSRMPPSNLTGEELQDLLDYLETLG